MFIQNPSFGHLDFFLDASIYFLNVRRSTQQPCYIYKPMTKLNFPVPHNCSLHAIGGLTTSTRMHFSQTLTMLVS